MKACKFCGSELHQSAFCYQRPRKKIKAGGKHAKWIKFRQEWKMKHAEQPQFCYICGIPLRMSEVTLDHVIPRSRRPDLVFDESNVKPCCWKCNGEKGSKTLDKLI